MLTPVVCTQSKPPAGGIVMLNARALLRHGIRRRSASTVVTAHASLLSKGGAQTPDIAYRTADVSFECQEPWSRCAASHSTTPPKRTSTGFGETSAPRGWSQPVDATLYLKGE